MQEENYYINLFGHKQVITMNKLQKLNFRFWVSLIFTVVFCAMDFSRHPDRISFKYVAYSIVFYFIAWILGSYLLSFGVSYGKEKKTEKG